MYARGTWAVFGLGKESLESFQKLLADKAVMVSVSEMAASAVTRHTAADAVGINPFGAPRLDEEFPLGLDFEPELVGYSTSEPEERAKLSLADEILDCQGYAVGEEHFRIHPSMNWFGMWAVLNEHKDVSDLATVKEHRSYRLLERPYKFLQSIDKKTVDQDTLGTTAAMRKQVPVLLDYHDGRAYIENGNQKIVYSITVRLRQMGVDLIPVAWKYPVANWHIEILNKLYEGTQFQNDFVKRAEEAARFKKNEIEKLEDRELETIVSKFFSMTQLPSDVWVGMSGPAQIGLHDASPPIAAKAPTSATTLLHVTDEAKVLASALTFQEVVSATSKKGTEYTFRKDLLSLDLNEKINLTDIGAAMLRGFSLPNFKKDILREIKQTKQVPSIDQFWGNWLHQMGNAVRVIEGSFRELLELDGKTDAGILPMELSAREERQEAAVNA